MSYLVILRALHSGPKTSAQLSIVTGNSTNYVARQCGKLIKQGKARRIDGGAGRGSLAIYGLTDHAGPIPKAIRERVSGAGIDRAARIEPERSAIVVNRDPCFLCGTRGDLGCDHQPAQEATTLGELLR